MGSGPEAEDDLILKADHILTDHVDQALHRGALHPLNESGKITAKDITATIGDLATGQLDPHSLADQLTFITVIGTGAMDIAVAKQAYDKAIEQQIGQTFDFKA